MTTTPPLKKGCGNWVDGEKFWDRESELEHLQDLLGEGASLYVVAPRRTGKTSLLREAGNRLGAHFVYLFVDVESCRTPADMVVQIALEAKKHQGAWSRTVDAFREFLGDSREAIESLGIDQLSIKFRDGVTGDWRVRATRLLSALASCERPVVICLDELPMLVNKMLMDQNDEVTPEGRQAAEDLMSWLRSMVETHRGQLSLVLCGSIGLEPVLARAKLSGTLSGYTAFHLDAWSPDTAVACLEALADNYGVTFQPGATDEIVERLGLCVPHYVQLFFELLHEDCRRRKTGSCTREDVARVYHERLLSSRGHPELSQLEERLQTVLGRHLMPLAIDLLTEAAVCDVLRGDAALVLAADNGYEGTKAGEMLRRTMAILKHDGYLQDADGGHAFQSHLLRDWWRGRFGQYYRPAAERTTP